MKFSATMFILWVILEIICLVAIIYGLFVGKNVVDLFVLAIFAVVNQIYYKLELKE
jgi:hypothetical protein